jgi:two-component system phosphate regulon sensor histidine kinase PhoR
LLRVTEGNSEACHAATASDDDSAFQSLEAKNRAKGNRKFVLSVSDNGIGISKEDLPRIFERFYRADKPRSTESIRGTGLGLAIVKHFAQLHGGRVEAESEIGKGTTIRMVLPIAV